jgi:amidase
MTFAAKDLFEVAGHRCCCGNPDWLRTHEPVTTTAAAIDLLVREGATLVGKTTTDELAYSVLGVNHWYGTSEPGCTRPHLRGIVERVGVGHRRW